MTGREFFSRFPELHSFLLSQLQAACQGIDRLLLSVLCMILVLFTFYSPKFKNKTKNNSRGLASNADRHVLFPKERVHIFSYFTSLDVLGQIVLL